MQVEKEEVDKLKEEAEYLNENNIRKLPRNKGSGDEEESETPDDSNSDASTDWEGSDDPDYGSKSKKPVVVKIKKEPRGSSSRNRKRPSFFQEFENEENNLDKILDDFEQEQAADSEKPKPAKKVVKNPGSRPRRKRRQEEPEEKDEEPVELETSRSGRVRKKPKFR